MDTAKILDRRKELFETSLTIEGFLMVFRDVAYIALDEKNSENLEKSILIMQPEEFRRCLSTHVPAWGGSSAIYQDDIVISGSLCESENREFAAGLVNITTAKVVRDNRIFEVM